MVTSAAITAAPSTLVSLTALTGRALNTCRRTPSLAAGPVVMSAFFLVIYDGQLAAAAGAIVPGGSYVAFLLPVVLLTTAFSGGAISGQLLLRDLDSRYYACLALTPARRSVLVAAPTLAGTAGHSRRPNNDGATLNCCAHCRYHLCPSSNC